MQISDSIGDMLTRIRNANSAKHDTVKVPASNMKKAIAQILVDEGYIKGFKVEEDGKQGIIEIELKYGPNKSSVITGLRRVSKPGLRIYTDCENMPKVIKGLGIAILSTSKGVMTDKDARKANVGGEVLAFVW
ncbi:MAG: 30S ribosomal protein S8 [Ruminococcus sp.]|jgi:small subunit ribosomal protein S8|nr:30S ribosomal protein S8 [Oscillospiraceae bacterium]MCI6387767.1 30S ribosomal protein S8 [Ruminococcus sp.]MDY4909123.1 30S ribosomal protein S8 [Candidatus Fimenecus sp.]MDD6270591.1 30S ribosomal protein S8 [Ruminococcus sp.]MDD7344343.1 30S ribosomal protein S8 [Ruminococcus sp.]